MQDLRLPRVAVVFLRCHSGVGHVVASRSQQKQAAKTRKLECGRACDRTFIGRLGCRGAAASGGSELSPFGGACMRRRAENWPSDGQKRRILSSVCATRTGERSWLLCNVFYRQVSLQLVRILSSRCNSQAFPRLFCGESPNGEPFESALLCLSGATRQAFSVAEAESALRHVGCLFRTLLQRMRPRERFSTV